MIPIQLQTAIRALIERIDVEIEPDDAVCNLGAGCGVESWLHEMAHLVLLQGCLEIPSTKINWIGGRITDLKFWKDDGIEWGAEHELKTLSVELLVADVLRIEIDPNELALYAIDNLNLVPRWKETRSKRKQLAQSKQLLRAIREAQGSPEVIEAAAYLSRAIWAERKEC